MDLAICTEPLNEFIPPATRFIELPDPFPMKLGGVLHSARIAYETWGRLNTARDNAILILTGLSPSAHAASQKDDVTPGWWEYMIGPGKPIDTNRWYVICVNALGSCKGSTGPASLNPWTGLAYRLDFPDLSIEDIADAAAHVVRTLTIRRLASVVGTSMGGMSALAFLSRYPDMARSHINISGAAQASPFAIALRSLQRQLIRGDRNWNKGHYDRERYPQDGMIVARVLGLITYRSALEWDDRFGRRSITGDSATMDGPFGPEFAIEAYLQEHARHFARTYDPNCYLYLSRCIDRFDLGETAGGNVEAALSQLPVEKALVIGVHTDFLFPIRQQEQIAEGLRLGGVETQILALESVQGHDAFLKDFTRFGPPVANFLSSL